uniref:Uncharacterized protein LOC111101022 n=1 Tax=Crassostrea virginica TaxID=6565 RepID=A0A8B8ACQ3_CRAVI|nr:uncharacterized protein LOC111101022 [Crassostrea virginica]
MRLFSVSLFWGLAVLGSCATPKKVLKDRLSQEHCKQKIAGIRASAQTQPVIDINPTCDIGKISYMYSRKELQLSFWRDYPYQICLVELKRFEVLRANDNNNRQIEPIRDGNNVCFQNRNPNGGTVYVLLKPRGFTYVSEIFYEIQRMQHSNAPPVRSFGGTRDRSFVSTTPRPLRTFQPLPALITPVPDVRTIRRRPRIISPRPVPSPLPLSRQWFLRQLPVFRERLIDQNEWRRNELQRENTRLRQSFQRFLGQ